MTERDGPRAASRFRSPWMPSTGIPKIFVQMVDVNGDGLPEPVITGRRAGQFKNLASDGCRINVTTKLAGTSRRYRRSKSVTRAFD